MATQISTGHLARLLGTSESRIAELIRRQRLSFEPTLIAGRRLWTREQALEVANLLGLRSDPIHRAYQGTTPWDEVAP